MHKIGWKIIPGGFSTRWTRCRHLKNPLTLIFWGFRGSTRKIQKFLIFVRISWKMIPGGFSIRWARCRYLKKPETLIFRVNWVFVVIHEKFKTNNSDCRIGWKLVFGGFSIRWTRCRYLKNQLTLIFRGFRGRTRKNK